jgi:putative ABC transport system substrate-binding protein
MIRRRDFITLLGGAAAVWPLAAHSQQGDRVRRIGVLTGGAENDPGNQSALMSFRQGLEELGWIEHRKVVIDYRWGAADVDLIRRSAVELAAVPSNCPRARDKQTRVQRVIDSARRKFGLGLRPSRRPPDR